MSAARRPPSRANSSPVDDLPATEGPDSGDHFGIGTDGGASRAPSVPGFVTGRLLGSGGSASVWLVTDSAGQRFALKVLHTPPLARRPLDGEATIPPPVPGPGLPGRRARREAVHPGEAMRPDPEAGDEPPAGSAADHEVASGWSAGAAGAAEEDVLHRELSLLRHLRHEHLVRVHAVIETDQGPALLMDLAVGGSLLDLVRNRGPLPLAEVVTALAPVAQALGHLHESGALHGDITPGNILFTHEGKPLLADFGTGRLLGAEPLAMPGTPGFIDPAGTTVYDAGVDVFALAAVAWFALTGRVPGPTEQRPPLALIVPEVPDALMHLIEDGLSSDRRRRPSAGSFARTLLAASTPGPVNLVPAVHASVLPELLTRRSERSAEPTSRWGRRAARRGTGRRTTAVSSGNGAVLTGQDGGRRHGRDRVEHLGPVDRSARRSPREARTGSRPDPAHRPRRIGATALGAAGRRPSTDRRTTDRSSDGGSRMRRVLAVASGCTAIVLLVTGIVLTVGGTREADDVLSEPATQGEELRTPSPSDESGGSLGEAPTGVEESQVETPVQDRSSMPGSEGTSEGSAAALVVAGEDPVAALQALVDRRASAFGDADPAVLQEVDVEGSPAMAADRGAIDTLERSGTRLRDLSIAVRDARILTGSESVAGQVADSLPGVTERPDDIEAAAVVRATMQLSPYTTERSTATEAGVVERRESAADDSAVTPPSLMAAGQQELVFVLWDTAEGWRIHSVVEP